MSRRRKFAGLDNSPGGSAAAGVGGDLGEGKRRRIKYKIFLRLAFSKISNLIEIRTPRDIIRKDVFPSKNLTFAVQNKLMSKCI